MKAIIDLEANTEISMKNGTLTVAWHRDFSVKLTEFQDKKIKEMNAGTLSGWPAFWFTLNEWEIYLRSNPYNKEHIFITRFRRTKPGAIVDERYLNKAGDWVPTPSSLGPLPEDAMKIKLFV